MKDCPTNLSSAHMSTILPFCLNSPHMCTQATLLYVSKHDAHAPRENNAAYCLCSYIALSISLCLFSFYVRAMLYYYNLKWKLFCARHDIYLRISACIIITPCFNSTRARLSCRRRCTVHTDSLQMLKFHVKISFLLVLLQQLRSAQDN